MANELKWGVLGQAKIAEEHVIPAIYEAKGSTLYAVASRRPFVDPLYDGVKVYNAYEDLLDDQEVDAVYIPLPNGLHCEWALAAMKKGKHVLCEKPIAMTAEECRRMIATADVCNVVLMEAFMYRFNKKTELLLELLDSDVIGKIKSIRVNFGYLKTRANAARDLPELGGGSLYDVGCYCIDIMNFLMRRQGNTFESCSSTFRMAGRPVDQAASAWVRYSGDVLCTMDCWFDVASHQSLIIMGEKGMLHLDEAFRDTPDDIELYTPTARRSIAVERSSAYVREIEVFTEAALTGNRSNLMPLPDSYANMCVMDEMLANRP